VACAALAAMLTSGGDNLRGLRRTCGHFSTKTQAKCIWRRRNSNQTLILEQKLERDAQIQEKVSYCHKFQMWNFKSSIIWN